MNTNESNTNPSENTNEGVTGDDKIDLSKITYSTTFSEGYAFVNLDKDLSKEYCIDKQGNVIFVLNVGVHGTTTGFHNGINLFGTDWQKYALCDKTGKIITAEDLGGTNILFWTSEPAQNYAISDAFAAGYFFVEKNETTFESSTTKAAIFNSKLEKIADFSEELYANYEKFMTGEYYDGYLYKDLSEAFDLRTGKVVPASNELLESINIAYPSDFWKHSGNAYYDVLSGSNIPVIDLTKHAETLSYASDFKCGESYLIFRSNNVLFFTVLLENGEFAFEPIKIEGSSLSVKRSEGKYAVMASGHGQVDLYTFDKSGKLAEIKNIANKNARLTLEMAENVIIVEAFDGAATTYKYYNFDLTLLFGEVIR